MKQDDLSEYLRAKEPGKAELAGMWRAAIGLQKVDGLTPSAYLMETARRNIEGEITLAETEGRSMQARRLLQKIADGQERCASIRPALVGSDFELILTAHPYSLGLTRRSRPRSHNASTLSHQNSQTICLFCPSGAKSTPD